MNKESFSDRKFKEVFPVKSRCIDIEFYNCKFSNINIENFDLSGSSFIDCEFYKCKFLNSEFNNCSFQNVVFENCQFLGILFSKVREFLLQWKFLNSKFEYCMFEGLEIEGSEFSKSKIFNCTFVRDNLKESVFSEVEFSKSSFSECNLEGCDFRGATNYMIDVNNCRLKKAKFSQSEVCSLLDPFGIEIE